MCSPSVSCLQGSTCFAPRSRPRAGPVKTMSRGFEVAEPQGAHDIGRERRRQLAACRRRCSCRSARRCSPARSAVRTRRVPPLLNAFRERVAPTRPERAFDIARLVAGGRGVLAGRDHAQVVGEWRRRQRAGPRLSGGDVCGVRPRPRSGECLADRTHGRQRFPRNLRVAGRRAHAHPRSRAGAHDPRRGGAEVAGGRAIHEAAGADVRDVRPGTRSGAHARSLPVEPPGRRAGVVYGRRVDLSPACVRHGRAHEGRGRRRSRAATPIATNVPRVRRSRW